MDGRRDYRRFTPIPAVQFEITYLLTVFDQIVFGLL